MREHRPIAGTWADVAGRSPGKNSTDGERGRNWARLLFLWFAPTSIVLTLMSTGLSFSFYAKSATYVLLAYLLLRGASSRYFRGVTSEAD